MATIPMDVLYSCILPRLPVKTLTRFKSVSKSWRTIISSPEFIHLYHHNALSSDANRLIVFVDWTLQEFHVHELDSPLSPSVHWCNPQPAPFFSLSILASCEFFLLINFVGIVGIVGLVLLNPSTGRYYQIPYPPSYQRGVERYGMYLDDANIDYKVVRVSQQSSVMEVMVYSLRTNEWRLIERTVSRTLEKDYAWCSVVIGHLLHIVFAPDYVKAKKRIGCFDILAEKWTTDVPMPPINVFELSIRLAVLDGLLCVETRDSMWVMKEYGVKDSWFELMTDDIWRWPYTTPNAFRKGSRDEVLCLQYRNSKREYIWYNVREKKATTATLNGVLPNATVAGIYGYICKGSLVDFPGGRNMKLHQPMKKLKLGEILFVYSIDEI